MRSPHMMSSVHLVMYGQTSKPLDPTSFCNLLISISLLSENTSTKLSRILKWKAGVIIFLLVCHFCPGKARLEIMKPKCHFSLLYKQRCVRTVKRNNYLIINPQIPEPKANLQSTAEHLSGQWNRKQQLTCGCQQACAEPAL